MAVLSKTLNEPYTHFEHHNDDGQLKDQSDRAAERFSLIAREGRQRGRFKLPGQVSKYELHEEDGEGNTLNEFVIENQYYERVEVTEDTIRNPTFKGERRELQDDGGEFTHYIIEYTGSRTESVHWEFHGETSDIVAKGVISLFPVTFEHDGIDIAYSIKPPEEDLDLAGIGPKLWGAMRPTKPIINLGVSIAELREIPRFLKDCIKRLDSLKALLSSLDNPKGLAEWFLAFDFGFLPLMSDLAGIFKAYARITKRIEFLKKNIGKPLFREVKFKPEVVHTTLIDLTTAENLGWMIDHIPSEEDPDEEDERWTYTLRLKKTTTIKASGVFLYFYNDDIPRTDAYWRAQVLGLIPNPSAIWEGLRWSWLIDWFSNAGDVLANFTNNLNTRVISTYAYSQREILREYTWTCTNGFVEAAVTRSFKTQRRAKIDPFGLAADVDLNDVQLAILVALGASRS